MAEDAKFDKTLMADLSRQSRQPMTVVSANAAYCYDRVNHVIMLLVWLVLTNGNIPAIVTALICLQTMKFFQRTGFGESKTFFGGADYRPYMMGLGQGNRAAPPSCRGSCSATWDPQSRVQKKSLLPHNSQYHHLPANIYGFSGGKKNIKFFFPPPRNKTSHVLICSVNLAFHSI
jgi:hypothetical protein